MYLAIDHPAIACVDVKRQIDWYCRTLGLKVVGTNGKDLPSVVLGYDESARGRTLIELMPAREPGPNPCDVPRFCPGVRHVAFRVDDFAGACEQLRAAGVQFIGEAVVAVGGGRIISFRDPEGNELQIVER